MMPVQICFNPESQEAMRRFWASDGEQLSAALLARTPDEQDFLLSVLKGEAQDRKGARV